MIWPIIITVLIITELCQSLTVIQPIYDYDDKEIPDMKKKTAGVTDHVIQNQASRKYGLRKSPNLRHDVSQLQEFSHRRPLDKTEITQPYKVALTNRLLSRAQPYKSGMISTILSIAQPGIFGFNEPSGYSNIYPVQYQYHNPYHKALPKLTVNEPVTAVTLQAEVLHDPNETRQFVKNATQPSLLNYNNKVYHVNKAISNQSYNTQQQQQQYPPHFIRKARNSNANHYDDKLIEHNFTEIQADKKDKDDDGPDSNRTASTIKQPSAVTPSSSSSTTSSHEIRYLHDIFLNYPKYHHVNYGHIELSPHLFEKRFETLKAGNRYKGEVIWLDNTGGYSQHYWNMAQGKL